MCLRWWQNLEKKIPLYLKRKLYIFFVSLNPISRHENRTLILLWFWFQTYHWDKVLKQHWRHPCTLVHFWNHRLDHNCCFFKEMIPQIVKYYWITRLKGGFTKGRTTKIKRGSTKDCHFSNPLYLISLMVRKKHQMHQMHCASHIKFQNLANHMKKMKQKHQNDVSFQFFTNWFFSCDLEDIKFW